MSWGVPENAAKNAGLKVIESDNSTPAVSKSNGAAGQKGEVNAKAVDVVANAGGGAVLAKLNKPYVIYFCTKDVGDTVGMGTEALRERAKQKGVTPHKMTIFESLDVMDAFKAAGFTDFFKVIASKENADLIKKYQVRQDNTLVFCAPDGEMVAGLAGMQCSQTSVLKLLKDWPQVYEAWKKKNAK